MPKLKLIKSLVGVGTLSTLSVGMVFPIVSCSNTPTKTKELSFSFKTPPGESNKITDFNNGKVIDNFYVTDENDKILPINILSGQADSKPGYANVSAVWGENTNLNIQPTNWEALDRDIHLSSIADGQKCQIECTKEFTANATYANTVQWIKFTVQAKDYPDAIYDWTLVIKDFVHRPVLVSKSAVETDLSPWLSLNNEGELNTTGASFDDYLNSLDYIPDVLEIDCGNDEITAIGEQAFSNCVALKTGLIDTIQFKNVSSLTIENAAFSECTGIEQVDFSGYVSSNPVSLSINQYAFAECRQLKEINFSSPTGGGASTFSFSIGDYAFEGCEELTGFTKNSENTSIVLTNIGNAPFFKCGKLTFDGVNALASSLNTSKISNGTNGVAIVANTWGEATCIVTGDMGNTLASRFYQSIGDKAFWGCASLTKIDFSSSSNVRSIGEGAFQYCTSLTDFYFPRAVLEDNDSFIASYAFNDCLDLKNIYFPYVSVQNPVPGTFGNNIFDGCPTDGVFFKKSNQSNLEYTVIAFRQQYGGFRNWTTESW